MQVISFIAYILIDTFVRPLFSFFEMEVLFCWTLSASVLILIILLLRFLLRERVSCRIRYALWLAVAVRLLLPLQLPMSLPWSTQALTPEIPQSWEKPTVPIFPGRTTSVEEAHPYYSAFEPGYLGPGPWSSGYVRISDDGGTVTTYNELYSPSEVIQLIWLAAALGMGIVLIRSNARFVRNLEKRRKPLEVENCPLPVYVAEDLPSPCLFGVFRPAVYVTPETAADETALRHVLAHELTHYAHKDHLWAAVRCLCLALHWYNPLVWLAAGLSKRDGELACDEGAVARLGEAERVPYGRTLVDMVAARSGRPADLFSCSTSMTGGKKLIQQRVARLVQRPETARTALFLAASSVALTAVFVFAGQEQPKNASFYDQYHRQLSAAQGMGRSSPMLHNNRIITDPDQLNQARELLALEPLTEEEILRQWDGVWNDTISFNSNIPTPDWTGPGDGSPSYYVSWEDGCYYILLPTERKEGELNSGIYLGKLSEENWGLADELFEQAPSVDDRLHAAGLASGRYTVAIDEHPEAMEALTQLFVNDEFFLSQNARTHDTAPENIAAWLSGRGSELIAPEIYVVGFNPWTLSAFGDGSLLFIDLSIPDHLTALVEDICQSSGIIPSV